MYEITGIILSGGKSSRMGRDKAFLPFPHKPLIEIMIDKLSVLFNELIVVTGNPHLYSKYGIRTVKDIIPQRGPLGGIYTGLLFSKNHYNFIVACDMPFLNPDLVHYMVQKIKGYDLVVPEYGDQLQPLCAIYSKNCIESIKEELSGDNLKVTCFFKNVKQKLITEEEIKKTDFQGLSFVNINTPEEYKSFKGSL